MKSISTWIGVAALCVSATLTGCSSGDSAGTERAAEGLSQDASQGLDQAITGSQKTMISVENQVVLPDGSPTTMTWRVSKTQNAFWDGSSRPDHVPPQGFQGLTQASGSGPYQARAEVNDTDFSLTKPNFTLTPTIDIEGETIALEPLLMIYGYNGWELVLKDQTIYGCGTTKFQAQTSRGPLSYEITGTCPSLQPKFVIASVAG